MKLLVVDDDVTVLDAVAEAVSVSWLDAEVLTAYTPSQAIDVFAAQSPDIVVLDVGMPGGSGFDVLSSIRRVSDVPIVMLTARAEDTDVVRGLYLGADVYVTKPFSVVALLARLEALLQRSGAARPISATPDVTAGDLTISFAAKEVRLRGEVVQLAPTEYRLLHHLVTNPGQVIPHAVLIDRVWNGDERIGLNHLKAMVSRLRAKIEPDSTSPRFLETEYGVGYRFQHSGGPR